MCATKACTRGGKSASRRPEAARRGNIIVLSAFLMVFMMVMAAFAVDVGYICVMRAQLQRQVDAAALAGAGDLIEGIDEAKATAKEYLVRNPVGSSNDGVIDDAAIAGAIIEFETEHGDDLEMVTGDWNPVTRTFAETEVNPSTLVVSMTYPDLPFFFGRVIGHDTFMLHAESTAQYQPRDIMVVLDYSASMNDDSSFGAIGKLPAATVQQSLLNCWADLGVSYGNLPATPTWATAQGVALNVASQIPHISVEYRYNIVYVSSTHNMTQVKVEFSNGTTQTWTPGVTSGTFQGSGANSTRQIRKVWVKSWSNNIPFGADGEYFNFTSGGINTTLKNALGLNLVTYPYPGYGSWDAYIDHVESSGTENDSAGYRYKFGGMNLVEWWMDNWPENYKIPDLWKCRAEPMYALKDATDVFMDFIQSVDTNDRVGLVVYNGPGNGAAKLEYTFTDDLDLIANSVQTKQAGHYHQYTGMGSGMTLGRQTLQTQARPHAYKMMVLMTDGLANWHNGQYDLAGVAAQISSETAICAAEKFKVMTISLGVDADTSTMQAVADGTEGTHYNVPGGSDYAIMHQQLYDAFEAIAKARPIKLVK